MALRAAQPERNKPMTYNPATAPGPAGIKHLLKQLGIQPGVMGAGDYKVTQRAAGATMSVDVAAGDLWVPGSAAFQGIYEIPNDATINIAIPGSSGSPRVDRVILHNYDSTFSGSADMPAIEVIQGSGAAGAQAQTPGGAGYLSGAAAVPSNAILLADVEVAAGAGSIVNANIVDRRPWARGAAWRGAMVGDPGTAAAHPPQLISASLNPRMELSGLWPVEIRIIGRWANFSGTTPGNAIFEPFIDGARTPDSINGSREQAVYFVAANSGVGAGSPVVLTIHPSSITAGLHKIGPAWSSDPSMSVRYGYANTNTSSPRIWVRVRELVGEDVNAYNG